MPQVFVSIGSNVEAERHVRFAVRALRELFGDLDVSPVYRTASVGFEGDDFLNLAVGFATDETVEAVDAALDAIESAAGRNRDGARFAPRTLDLDLMLYGDAVIDGIVEGRRIRVPRREILEYAFMLQPLADIAADFPHPSLGATVGELAGRADLSAQRCERVDFDADSEAR